MAVLVSCTNKRRTNKGTGTAIEKASTVNTSEEYIANTTADESDFDTESVEPSHNPTYAHQIYCRQAYTQNIKSAFNSSKISPGNYLYPAKTHYQHNPTQLPQAPHPLTTSPHHPQS